MLIVPLKGDRVLVKDDAQPRVVSSYSNLKDQPAVYLTPDSSKERYLYLSDIVELNGVRVEYDGASKTFNALGPLERKLNLPQPGDTITVRLIDVPYKDEKEELEVTALKLHSSKYGVSKGLRVICGDSDFSLNEILDIERKVGNEPFNPRAFQKLYLDYLPMNTKSKA